MKIKVINPDFGLSKEELKIREDKLKKAARPDTVISMECPRRNNIYIDSMTDVALDAGELIQMAMKAEKDGFDAVCIYCFSDPAIEACREVLNIPVFGGGQTSILVAALLGYSFSILTTGRQRESQKRQFVRTTGVDYSRLCSIRSIEFSMEESNMERAQLIEELSKQARKCVDDGADVVILGCLSFIGTSEEISRKIGVPVVDPAYVLINMAELSAASGLCHSKRAYPYPPERERYWEKGSIDI
jgi:allantoin racemase